MSFVLQWDQPFFSVSGGAGPTTDLDIFLVDIQEATALAASTSNNRIAYGGTGEPVEVFYFTNDFATETRFNVMIVNWASQTIQAGPNPTALKVARFGGNTTIQEFDTASATGYGHANAAGAEAVGAAFYGATPEYGICPLLESFSSAGGTPILLNIDGTPKAVPEVRQKPGIVAPDGVNTTFFGVDVEYDADTNLNFFGTSAAAPNAAAVAALMLETDPTLSPSEVYEALESTAIRMTHRNDSANLGSVTPGDAIVDPDGTEPDFDSGFGLIQANLAVQAVQTGPSLPRVIVTDICTYVAEGGASDSYSAVLSSQPTDDVIVTISPDNQVNVSPSSLTFTPSDWAAPQVVTVTAADDAVAEAAAAGTITHLVTSLSDTSYNGISTDDVTVNISDDDIAGVSMNTMTVAESGATDSYNMALNSEPTADVTVTVSPDAQLSASAASLIFTPGNWSTPQTVIVSAVDDLIAEGPHTGAISHAASSADPNYNYASFLSFTASIIDNDSADTTAPAFSSGSVASDGMTVTVAFDEALANSQPLGSAFVVTGSSSGDVPGTAAPAAISGADVTFTLASPLSAGETATLAYTQPLSDPRIQDAAANLTATFGGASIANNTAGAEVTVTSFLPASAPNANDSFAVTITGSGFASGASVTFLNGSGPAPVASVNTVSDTTIAATLTTKKGGKPVERKWDVRVTNPGGSLGVLAEGFTITP